MDVFTHHLLEYKKGLRTLVLHTTEISNRDAIKKEKARNRCPTSAPPYTILSIFLFVLTETILAVSKLFYQRLGV